MRTQTSLSAAALFLATALVTGQAAAQLQDPTVYTYIAQFRVEPAKRVEFVTHFNQHAKPVLDRLLAGDMIIEWGRATPVVHTEDGMTDLIWWCSTKASSTLNVIDELGKANIPPSVAAAHRDTMLESVLFRMRKNTATGGYVYVSDYTLQTGKSDAWMEEFNRRSKPIYERLLADGAILGYGVDFEYVHTADPRARSVWVQTEDADSVDKVNAAFASARAAMTSSERAAMLRAMEELLVAEGHRDWLGRVVEYRHK